MSSGEPDGHPRDDPAGPGDGTRGAPLGAPSRQIAWRTASCTVEIELDPEAGHLVGHVVPPTPGRVELFGPAGEASVEPADDGAFRLELPCRGPVALRVTGDVDLRTPWLTW